MMISIAGPYSRMVTSRVPVGSIRRLRIAMASCKSALGSALRRSQLARPRPGGFDLVDQRDAACQVGAELQLAKRDDDDRRGQCAQNQANFPAVVGHLQPIGDHAADNHGQYKQADDHDAVEDRAGERVGGSGRLSRGRRGGRGCGCSVGGCITGGCIGRWGGSLGGCIRPEQFRRRELCPSQPLLLPALLLPAFPPPESPRRAPRPERPPWLRRWWLAERMRPREAMSTERRAQSS